jgi:hypothetical protein
MERQMKSSSRDKATKMREWRGIGESKADKK